MVTQIIQLIVYVAIFIGAALLADWLIAKGQLPTWVRWIVFGLLLIVLVLFLASQFSSGGSFGQFNLFPARR